MGALPYHRDDLTRRRRALAKLLSDRDLDPRAVRAALDAVLTLDADGTLDLTDAHHCALAGLRDALPDAEGR